MIHCTELDEHSSWLAFQQQLPGSTEAQAVCTLLPRQGCIWQGHHQLTPVTFLPGRASMSAPKIQAESD